MKKYGVCLPFTDYRYLEVEAENEKEALDKAFEIKWDEKNIGELEYHEKVTEGNVCHAVMNEYSIEEINE